MGTTPGFFDFDDRLKRLSDLGDQLEAFGTAVDFEMFRADLVAALDYTSGPQGGRPPFDPVMMFKILVIQAANNLSDERAEFRINDRLSVMRFLGLGLSGRVPDARTIWLFREKLTKADAIKGLFERFDAALRASGYIAMSGQIPGSSPRTSASLVAAPRQSNTDEEKKAIKEGRVPEEWKKRPAKLRHKDRDARWTVKFAKAKEKADGTKPPVDIAIPTFGYQNHIAIDRRFGFIRTFMATDAAAYEGARLREELLDKTNTASDVWAIPLIVRPPTRRSWLRTASSAGFIARSRRASRCQRQRAAPTMPSPRSVRRSSTSLPNRRTGWACSSARSASHERRPRSAWPTSSTTSSA
ncbi:Transposase [Consotaella salsifontis]|uniref:Transposase n=1 Tax=Consotaella salsifontis TaxID=1365950 RepID=A0A1T4TAE2_9HYPH|nr:Transposase [Consotaella salsifontis]